MLPVTSKLQSVVPFFVSVQNDLRISELFSTVTNILPPSEDGMVSLTLSPIFIFRFIGRKGQHGSCLFFATGCPVITVPVEINDLPVT